MPGCQPSGARGPQYKSQYIARATPRRAPATARGPPPFVRIPASPPPSSNPPPATVASRNRWPNPTSTGSVPPSAPIPNQEMAIPHAITQLQQPALLVSSRPPEPCFALSCSCSTGTASDAREKALLDARRYCSPASATISAAVRGEAGAGEGSGAGETSEISAWLVSGGTPAGASVGASAASSAGASAGAGVGS